MDAMSPGHIKQQALYEEVAERLRQRIFKHELPPGSWIEEQALAEEFGISRTPLREALKVLASEGLVTLKPRRGCYVAEISREDLEEIFPVLALLEGRCAYEATTKAGPEDLRRLRALHEALEQRARGNDVEGFFDANQAFHRAVQEIAGNRWLLQIIGDMRKVMKLTRHHSLLVEGRLQESLKEHRRIIAAIAKGDAAGAEENMRLHLMRGREAMSGLHGARRGTELSPQA